MRIDATPFELFVRLGRDQFGLVTFRQARLLGLTAEALNRHVNAGRIERVVRGLYGLPGYPDSPHRRVMAACLRVGAGGVASHSTAAFVHQLEGFSRLGRIEVTVPVGRLPRAADIKIYRTHALRSHHLKRLGRISVTSVEQTLLDLGGVVPEEMLEIALDSALRRRLTRCDRVQSMLDELGERGRAGTANLRRVLEYRPGWKATDSGLETKVLRLLRRADLPPPEVQKPLGSDGEPIGRVDLFYPDRRLVIEVDSYRYHTGRVAWQNDLRRQNRLVAEGFNVLRFTEADVDDRPNFVITTIASFLEHPFTDSVNKRPEKRKAGGG